jgi:hypothetical protein
VGSDKDLTRGMADIAIADEEEDEGDLSRTKNLKYMQQLVRVHHDTCQLISHNDSSNALLIVSRK